MGSETVPSGYVLSPTCWSSARRAATRQASCSVATVTGSPVSRPETAAMLFWALLAAGQITMRKVDGWQTLTHKLTDEPIDLAA
jgi:hypothetical protein